MRRFAKAFVKARDKKTSNSSSASATTTTTTTTSIITTTIGTASDSSATSTSSIKCNESTKKPSWKSWLGRSRKPAPVWTPSLPVAEPLTLVIDDDDDDDSSELSTPFSSILDPDLAKGNFRRIVSVALDHSHTSPSPFVQPSHGPLFPRSINSPNLLSPSKSLLSGIQRRQLLSRLESQVDVSSILPFAVKQPPSIPASHPSPNDISLPPSDVKLSSASLGIQRWINRPCFEDRYVVHLPFEDGQVDTHPVTASSLAIAALEYSEHLDVMADPDFDQPPSKHGNDYSPPPPSTSHASLSESSSLTASTRSNTSYTTAPSPLRNQHSPPPHTPTVHQPTADQSKSQPAIKSTVKRVVRFAEDDSDGEDGLPLHIVRMKKKREQKAQFLRQEQLQRAKQQEEERGRREQEAVEREKIRLEAEMERKAREKERIEREKALYAETVAAARMRREMQRAGTSFTSNTTNSSSPLVPSTSFTSLKDSERNKPPPDSKRFSSSRSSFRDPSPSLPIPRREPSDSALHLSTPPLWSNYLTDSSPSSSRPPSLSHSPVSPTYGPHSRPPSTYSAHSSSSEDARRGGSRRNSAANSMPTALGSAGSNSSFHLPPMMGYPTWIPSGYIQPVPSFLEYPHDMPLLPPTAPFMKHDKRSRNSSPGGNSTSSGSRRGSFNSSTDRLDRPPNARAASNPVPRRDGSTSGHSRQPSGDSSRSQSTQARPPNPTHKSQPVISRGRSSLPPSHSQNQYLQAPSPWSALPSQFGTLPTSMPWSSSQMRQSQSQSTGGKQRRQQTYPLVS